MCTCIPEPVAFGSLAEVMAATVERCPTHGERFDPQQALVLCEGEWVRVCSPSGEPNLRGDVDDMGDLTPEAAIV